MSIDTTLSIKDLAQQLNNAISSTDSRLFQTFIQPSDIHAHPDIIKILSDILASTMFSKQQKVIASSSFTYIYDKNLNSNPNLSEWLHRSWDEYFTCMMNRNDDDLIDWPYISNTGNALRYLIGQLCEQDFHINNFGLKYTQTTFQGKLMLMQTLINHDNFAAENQFLFIRQTIEDFANEALNVVMNLHELPEITFEQMVLQHDTMMVLYEWINMLSNCEDFEEFKDCDFMFILSKQQSLVDLIREQLKSLINVQNGRVCYRKSQKLVELYDSETMASSGNKMLQKMLQYQLNIKSYTINLLYFLSLGFSSTAELVQFDTCSILSMTQLLTPIFITELAQNKLLKHDYIYQNHKFSRQLKSLTIQIFTLLKRSANFIFLLDIYTQNHQLIIYQVFYDYLRTTQDEKQAYQSDPNQFVSYNQSFVQILADDLRQTPKQACAQFLQSFFELNNKAQVDYMQFLAAALRHNVLQQDSQIVYQIKRKGYQIPQTEMIYAILTRIFYVTHQTKEDMFKFIYDQFLAPEIVFSLTKIQKTRVLFFLNYSYSRYFAQSPNQGIKFIEWTSQTKQNSQTEFKIVMELLVTAFKQGIPQKVLDYVNHMVQHTARQQIFKFIIKLLDNHHESIDPHYLLEMAKRICQRIKTQFTHNSKQHFLEHKGVNYSIFEKCFHILQQLSENQPLVNRQSRILEQVLDLVDFFNQQGVQIFQLSTEVVILLNNIIKFQDVVPIQFERYLVTLGKIVDFRKDFGPLLETYYFILLKAGQTFSSHPQFLSKIKESLQQRILVPDNWKSQPIVIQTLFLLSNILLVYPQLCQQNREVFLITQNILEKQKINVDYSDKLCASILLYWMAGEYAFGNYNLGKLSESKIEIFRDQFGLMFALSLNKLIEKYHNTQSLETLLKLAIKLLDYECFYKKESKYRGPKFTISIFKKLLQMDSFDQISCALEFLKKNLDRQTYAKTIEMMRNDYGSEALSKLLSIRIIDNTKERNIVFVKKD